MPIDDIPVPHILAQRIVEQGLSLPHVLRQAGLPQTLFQQEKITLKTRQIFALWRAIGEVSSDPAIGLKIGGDDRVERYHPITIMALSARSFGDALLKLARYKRLCGSEEVSIVERDGQYMIEFRWLHAAETDTEPLPMLDAVFASVVEMGRRGSGRALYPARIEWQREESHRALYESHFRCPIRFGAERDRLVYSSQAIAQPFITHNPEMLAMLSPPMEAALSAHMARQTLSDQVKGIQRRLLPGQRPSIQEVAAELHLSPRTLQRRLADDGVTYQQLLEEVRSEMARHYLAESSLHFHEISYLLGYEEANSFHRAFHNWAGMSPGRWRAVQQPPA